MVMASLVKNKGMDVQKQQECRVDLPSPVGLWRATIEQDAVTCLTYLGEHSTGDIQSFTHPLAITLFSKWKDYFSGKTVDWSDIPVSLDNAGGTEFQRNIWQALKEIPEGATVTYKQLAEQAGSPKAYRAVGQAVGRNPIAVLLPCHRVLGSDGNLCGFMLGRGQGLSIKEHLLKLEGIL